PPAPNVDAVCELAGMGDTVWLSAALKALPPETAGETFRDRDLATPLHRACSSGHMHAAEAIIGRLGREVIYVRDVYGRTPLHCAIYYHRLELVSYLLHLGADTKVKDGLGLSCYRLIKRLGRADTEFLLSRLEPGVLEASLVLHFLECAFELGLTELCRRLCELVDPVESPFYRPPLHQAAEIGDELDVISDLDVILDGVIDTSCHRRDTRDANGHLAFHYACQHGHGEIAGLLYFSDMDNADFCRGVRLALTWRRYQTVQMLTALRPEFTLDQATLSTVVKELDTHLSRMGRFVLPVLRQSPILLARFVPQAAAINDTNILSLLLNLQVPMNGYDLMRRTALHEACQKGHEKACRFLLQHGAEPAVRDWRGA
ncbi:hypothetical protein EGW08_005622, partial [Elysia chlorotica]